MWWGTLNVVGHFESPRPWRAAARESKPGPGTGQVRHGRPHVIARSEATKQPRSGKRPERAEAPCDRGCFVASLLAMTCGALRPSPGPIRTVDECHQQLSLL